MTYLALAGGLFLAWLVLVVLFAPGIAYRVRGRLPLDSPAFLHTVQSTCQAALHRHNRVLALSDGETFYPAMLEAIRTATGSINMECYIFQPGRMADAFVDALVERARAGVMVRLVLDALGSASFSGEPMRRLEEAGCRVGWYRPLRWYSLHRMNNRTHRELLIVDGRIGFIGGAGVADRWRFPERGRRPWRDMMARVEGPAVAAIQGVFMENWLECEGEILTGEAFFPLDPFHQSAGEGLGPPHDRAGTPPLADDITAFLVRSSPADRATVSRVVFQLLIENAWRGIDIATPYFLPDRALRRGPGSGSAFSCRAPAPISAGCDWRAGACTASCSTPASGSSSTIRACFT